MSIQTAIEQKIRARLQPDYLAVSNESHKHRVPINAETHFKVVVVSTVFNDQRKVKRHQMVYDILRDELAGSVHALALHTYTPHEWQQHHQAARATPDCQHR